MDYEKKQKIDELVNRIDALVYVTDKQLDEVVASKSAQKQHERSLEIFFELFSMLHDNLSELKETWEADDESAESI